LHGITTVRAPRSRRWLSRLSSAKPRPLAAERGRRPSTVRAAGGTRLCGCQPIEEDGMQKLSLDAVARQQLDAARRSSAGRAAHTIVGGHGNVLRQTVIAMVDGRELAEHENPGEATLVVLHGRVRLSTAADAWAGRRGDLLVVPPARHRLEATKDAVVLLTVAKVADRPR